MVNNIYRTSLCERQLVQDMDTWVSGYDDIIWCIRKDISHLCIQERMLLLRNAIIAISIASKQQVNQRAYQIYVFCNFCELSAWTQLRLLMYWLRLNWYAEDFQTASSYIYFHTFHSLGHYNIYFVQHLHINTKLCSNIYGLAHTLFSMTVPNEISRLY